MVLEKKKAFCKRCRYIWMTKSKKDLVCCPNCMFKVRLKPKRKAKKKK